MKLHLPKLLRNALMATFVVMASTTLGADIISVNFGPTAIGTDATGDVGGVGAAYWVNINGGTDGSYDLTANNDSGTVVGSLVLDAAQNSHAGGGTDTTTVLGAMQNSYLDLNANNKWVVDVQSDYMVADLTLYFSGDGGKYSPVEVNGQQYKGGTNQLLGDGETDWGDRSKAENDTLDTDNTIVVTGLAGVIHASSVSQSTSAKRATLSGLQVKEVELYAASLASGANTASALTFAKGEDTSSLSGIAEAERYISVVGNADDSSQLALDVAVKGLQVAGNTVTLTSAAGVEVLFAQKDTALNLATTLAGTPSLTLGGRGLITISENQVLSNLTVGGNVHVADNVTVEVTGDFANYSGTITVGSGASMFKSVNANTGVTVGGATVTLDKAWKQDVLNSASLEVEVSENATADVAFAGAGSVQFVKSPAATGDITITLDSFDVGTTGGVQSISAGEGVAVNGNFATQLSLHNGVDLTIGKGVDVTFGTTLTPEQIGTSPSSAGAYALCLANTKLRIDGGTVNASCLITGDKGSGTTLEIKNGGLLNITGNVDAQTSNKKSGTVRFSHWSVNTNFNLDNGGEFRVLDAIISTGDDGQAIISATNNSELNLKGIRMRQQVQVSLSSGSRLNLGTGGIINPTADAKLSITGGVLGALSAEGWSGAQDITLGDGSTVQLAVYDVNAKTYSGAADIALTGKTTMGGSIALAGGGTLTLSKLDLTSDTTLTGTPGLVIEGSQNLASSLTHTTGETTLRDFRKIGAGALTLGAVNIAGEFSMNAAGGALTMSSVTCAADTTLVYDKAGTLTQLGALGSAVTLNLYGVMDGLSDGVDLGFTKGSKTLDEIKALLTVVDLTEFSLSEGSNGNVFLTSTAGLATDWDKNWGAGLTSQPSAVKNCTPANGEFEGTYQYLYDVEANRTDGNVYLKLTGGAEGKTILGGSGQVTSDIQGDIWLVAEDGTYGQIVAGSRSQWANNAAATITGDTHILLKGTATVTDLVGGMYGDCDTVLKGDTYISVMGGDVTGSIYGSSVNAHLGCVQHQGDSYVFVYTPLSGSDRIVGGSGRITNGSGDAYLDGSTHVTYDLSAYTGGAVEIQKTIIGGHYYEVDNGGNSISFGAGQQRTITEVSNVSIKATDQVTFSNRVVGGSYITAGNNNNVGGISVELDGGVYTADVIAGSYIGAGVSSTNGATELKIKDGEFRGGVVGGTYVETGTATVSTGNVDITIEDGKLTTLYGGHFIGGGANGTTAAEAVEASIGDISITVSGGEVGTLIGGTRSWRRNADSTISQGNIAIELTGGTVGDVYAAGSQKTETKLSTASTSVTIGKDVTITSGKTISGGYEFESGMSGSTITGTSTLVLSGEQNRKDVNFKDFGVITNATAATIGTLSNTAAVTKNGTGVLTLGAATNSLAGGLTVSAGGLATSAATTLGGALTLSNGTSLNMTSGIITLTSDNSAALTLGQNLVLTVTDIAQESSATIISGFSNTDLISGEVEASNYFASINGSSMLDEYFLKVEGNNLVLIRTAPLVPETDWTWEGTTGGGGVWGSNADNWASNTGATSASTDVSFTAEGAGEVQIDGAVVAKDIYVTEGEYTFTQKEGTTGGITANSMTIRGDNTSVTIENANDIDTTNLKGGTLVLSGTTATTGGNVVLGGGLLKYDGSTLDISSIVSLANGYTGPVKIEVADDTTTTGVESVTWGTQTAAVTSGITAALTNGITKTGTGNLTLTWAQGTESGDFAGDISVSAGQLNLQTGYLDPAASSSALNYQGNIDVAEGAKAAFATTYDSSTYVRLTLSGDLTGKGTVQLGSDGRSGRYCLSGDNSQFAGTIRIVGDNTQDGKTHNLVIFNGENAFGGSATTVALNGRLLNFGGNYTNLLSSIYVESGVTNLLDGSSSSLSTLVFKGALTGNGTDVVFGTREGIMYNVTMEGDVSAYQGKLAVGSATTWTLGGDGIASAGAVQATLAGTGTVKTQYNNATTISGKVGTAAADTLTLEQAGTGALTVSGVIGGAANVKQSGTGALVLTATNTSTGTITIDSGKKVQLGTADTAGKWVGTTLAGAGTLEIVNGSLGNAMTRADGVTASIAVNATGKTISLGGTDAGLLSSVTLGAGSQLTDVTGTLTVGSAPAQSRATTTGGLNLLNLTLTEDNIGEGAAATTAMISGADITINDASKVTIKLGTDAVIDLLEQHRDASVESYLTLTTGALTCTNEQLQKLGIAGTLMTSGIRLDSVSGGSIVASGKVDGIYFVTDDNTTFPHIVSDYNTLGMYKGTVIKQGQSLDIKMAGDTAAATKVTLNNLLGGTGSSLVVTNTGNTGVVTVELSNQAVADTGVNVPPTIGTSTTMEGSITGNKGTELIKKGEGTLVVNGKLVADELEMTAGELQLNNASNTVTTLNGTGGTVQLGSGSKLTVSGGSLAGVTLKGAAGATSAPALKVNGALALTGTSALNGVALEVASGKTLSLAGTTNDVVSLSGSGTVAGVSGTVLSLDNAAAATYSGTLTGAGTLKVENGGGTFTLKNASTSDWSITNAGKMVVDMTGSDTTPGSFGAQALTLAGGSSTEFLVNTDNSDGLSLTSLLVEQGAALTITSTGINSVVLDSDGTLVLGTVDSLTLGDVNQVVTLQGAAFSRVDGTATLIKDGNELKLQVAVSKDNKYLAIAETTNGKAGAELLWNADSAAVAASPVLSELDTLLTASAAQGESQDKLLASVAGASTAVLGMAVSGDVERQLQAIRNRTTTMGVDQGVVNPEMPYFNAWINAEADNTELGNNGTEGGYKLNSWGGTVGFDVDFTPTLTAGLALTAMYGDLHVSGADAADGDLDTYYVSAFARYNASAWTHTFVATAGLADLSLNRTVMGEEVKGETDGLSFGLMYEVGRVFALNEDATACLQPVFNVSWRHTELDSYSEKGSALALDVDKQTYDTVSFGLGARLQAVVGESMYNRTSIFECRLLAKLDTGDTQGTSKVGLAGATAEVESAERGAFGLEAGAGLTIPLGEESSSIFADASIELRSDYTNVNGTVGYRINF